MAAPAPNESTTPSVGEPNATIVTACAIAAGIVAAFASAAPTGTPWWDVALRAGLAFVFVHSASRSHAYVVLGAAVIAAMFVGVSVWLVLAGAAFMLGLAGFSQDERRSEFFAVSAALTIQSLLHLKPLGFFGLPSIIAGVLVGVVLAGGFRASALGVRRRIARISAVCGAIVAVILVLGGLLGLGVRSDATSGVDAARRGLASARQGETEVLTAELETAKTYFASANDTMSSPLLRPLRLLPVVAQHHRSLATATGQGLVVATEAADAARDANIDQLQLRQGQFDLDLLASMGPQLASTAESLEAALAAIERERSPWLLPIIDQQLQGLVDEVAHVLPEAQVAAEAAAVLPDMLGATNERRYLMLFGAPAESREFGGFVGGYALISVEQGGLDLIEAGSTIDLVLRANEEVLDNPLGYPIEYLAMDPAVFPQNLTSTPNIGLIARAARDVFPELAGAPIDGVIYADPYALAAMTAFTGPITVDGVDEPLDNAGLVSFMFRDQYVHFPERNDRFTAIGNLASATAAGFEGADLPGPEQLGAVLGPAARAGRLQVITYDERENAFLASVRLQRDFSAPTEVDSVAIIQKHGTESKLDLYLHREVSYEATVASDGSLAIVAEVHLRSAIPDDAPELTFGETDGTNQVLLSMYSPHELTELSVDGQPHDFVVHEEFGFQRYALFKIALPPGGEATVRFELRGIAPPDPYRLAVWHQPLVNFDTVRIVYNAPGRDPIAEERQLTESWLFTAEN